MRIKRNSHNINNYISINKKKTTANINNEEKLKTNDTVIISNDLKIKPLLKGKDILDTLMQDISQATKSIKISIFAFSRKDIADLLINQAKKGVKISIIIDPNYYNKASAPDPELEFLKDDNFINYLKNNNIEVVKYPIPPSARRLFHPKLIIIDNKKTIIGGTNLTKTAFSHHDFAIEIENEKIAKEFNKLWQKDKKISKRYNKKRTMPIKPSHKKKKNKDKIQILQTDDYNDIFTYKTGIIETIKKAKNHIYLEMYALTDRTVIKNLIKAKERGVDVKVILDKSINQNKLTAKKLKAAGIKVKFWKFDGQNFNFMHAKLGLIDNSTIIGSGNWSLSGLNYNREIGAKIKNKEVENIFEKQFNKDWQESLEF